MFNTTSLGQFNFANPTKLTTNISKPSNQGLDMTIGAGDSNDSFDKSKLIVNYIPQYAVEEDLAQIFSQIGRVESIKIMRDFKTGYSYGFGFVKYYNQQDAAKAIEAINGLTFRNKRLKVSYSRPPGTDMKDSNLYITNLPKDVTEQDVDRLFQDYGEIVQRTVLKDKITGLPRGVAFVRYSKGEEAQAAIANLDGKMLENAMLPLSVRVAEDHGRQKAQYMDMWNPIVYRANFAQMRGVIPPIRDLNLRNPVQTRFPNRFTLNNLNSLNSPPLRTNSNMGAGDNYFQNSFFY